MICTICGHETVESKITHSHECNSCFSYFSSDKQFIGVNITNNFNQNDNYACLTYDFHIYYVVEGRKEYFDFNSKLNEKSTDKEKYDCLKKFINNLIFI